MHKTIITIRIIKKRVERISQSDSEHEAKAQYTIGFTLLHPFLF